MAIFLLHHENILAPTSDCEVYLLGTRRPRGKLHDNDNSVRLIALGENPRSDIDMGRRESSCYDRPDIQLLAVIRIV
jgi:hypothetical protein